MQSHYEINVAFNGRHLFATHERSLTDKETAKTVFELMQEKFPEKEGYLVTCTYRQCYGSKANFGSFEN